MRTQCCLSLGPFPLTDDVCPGIWATVCEGGNEFGVFTGLEPAREAALAHHTLGATHHSALAPPRPPPPHQVRAASARTGVGPAGDRRSPSSGKGPVLWRGAPARLPGPEPRARRAGSGLRPQAPPLAPPGETSGDKDASPLPGAPGPRAQKRGPEPLLTRSPSRCSRSPPPET